MESWTNDTKRTENHLCPPLFTHTDKSCDLGGGALVKHVKPKGPINSDKDPVQIINGPSHMKDRSPSEYGKSKQVEYDKEESVSKSHNFNVKCRGKELHWFQVWHAPPPLQ